MIIRKTGKERWHYSGQLAWALKRIAGEENNHVIDKVEWELVNTDKFAQDFMCKFVANFYENAILIYRISGKAVYLGGSVQLLISDKIVY